MDRRATAQLYDTLWFTDKRLTLANVRRLPNPAQAHVIQTGFCLLDIKNKGLKRSHAWSTTLALATNCQPPQIHTLASALVFVDFLRSSKPSDPA